MHCPPQTLNPLQIMEMSTMTEAQRLELLKEIGGTKVWSTSRNRLGLQSVPLKMVAMRHPRKCLLHGWLKVRRHMHHQCPHT